MIGILVSCQRLAEGTRTRWLSWEAGTSFGWGSPGGTGASPLWGLTVSLPVSELPPGSGPEAQGGHRLWGSQHQMGEGFSVLAGSCKCQIHRGDSGHTPCFPEVAVWTAELPQASGPFTAADAQPCPHPHTLGASLT